MLLSRLNKFLCDGSELEVYCKDSRCLKDIEVDTLNQRWIQLIDEHCQADSVKLNSNQELDNIKRMPSTTTTMHHRNKLVVKRIRGLKRIRRGYLTKVWIAENGVLEAVYYYAKEGEISNVTRRILKKERPKGHKRKDCTRELNCAPTWAIPDRLPVGHLEPLLIDAILERHPPLNPPLNNSIFYKELGWYPKKYRGSQGHYKDRVFKLFVEPLRYLIPDYDKWRLTPNSIESITKTFHDKLDKKPQENHGHHLLMWEAYKGISMHLRKGGFSLQKQNYAQVENTHHDSDSSMGAADYHLRYRNVGQYIKDSDACQKNVDEFRIHLMADRPSKADFYCTVKREQKKVDKTRVVWSLCATGRIYEAMVFGGVDDMLHNLPFTASRARAHNNGARFDALMQGGERVAVCDDINGWDSRVSHAMLCLEAEFLQTLTDDVLHKREIKKLYRLYAYAVVNIPRKISGKDQNVLYQLQGQVISGRRVTYAMNTLTNLVVNMCRAARSQGIPVGEMCNWTRYQLWLGNHNEQGKFGGLISGDDAVIIMNPKEAKLFASSVDFINEIGLVRKSTQTGKSKLVKKIGGINFCSRNYVEVPMYNQDKSIALKCHVPIKRVEEILMRKLLRGEQRDIEGSLVWSREQARDILIEYFHVKTIRVLSLAILSATPKDCILRSNKKDWSARLGSNFNEADIVRVLNDRWFGEQSILKCNYRAQKLADFGFIGEKDQSTYDLKLSARQYVDWFKSIYIRASLLKDENREYEDWSSCYPESVTD